MQAKRSGLFRHRHWGSVAPLPPAYDFGQGGTVHLAGRRSSARGSPEHAQELAQIADVCLAGKCLSENCLTA